MNSESNGSSTITPREAPLDSGFRRNDGRVVTSETLKNIAIDAAEALKATDITVIDVRKLTSVTDYMIICSGRSSRQIHSIAENVAMQAKKQGMRPLGIEGENSLEWVLVDLGDVVVHVMLPETRSFYALEKLWQQ